jgi:hypothetical protein
LKTFPPLFIFLEKIKKYDNNYFNKSVKIKLKSLTDMIKIIRISLLSIERRRWQNIERNLRICNLCDKKEIGDEFHYILEYNYFNNIRKKCIDNHYRKRQNIIKFGELMSIENQIKLTKH